MEKINVELNLSEFNVTAKRYEWNKSIVVETELDKVEIEKILQKLNISDIVSFYGSESLLNHMDIDTIREFYDTKLQGG